PLFPAHSSAGSGSQLQVRTLLPARGKPDHHSRAEARAGDGSCWNIQRHRPPTADHHPGNLLGERTRRGVARRRQHSRTFADEIAPQLRIPESLPEQDLYVAATSTMKIRHAPTLAILLATPALSAQRPLSVAGRSVVYAPHGIVATSQPLASTAGLAVLQRGGNAIDAAVTAAAVLSVTEPMMTGIGGDMFAIVWIAKEHRLVALNASGRAGSLMTREQLLRRGRTTNIPRGIETVTVPGALAGWQTLLDKYGTITLALAVEPAIRYAENGFVVT